MAKSAIPLQERAGEATISLNDDEVIPVGLTIYTANQRRRQHIRKLSRHWEEQIPWWWIKSCSARWSGMTRIQFGGCHYYQRVRKVYGIGGGAGRAERRLTEQQRIT
jgi:hypothetical protein